MNHDKMEHAPSPPLTNPETRPGSLRLRHKCTRRGWWVTVTAYNHRTKRQSAAHFLSAVLEKGGEESAIQAARALREFGVWADVNNKRKYGAKVVHPIGRALNGQEIIDTIWPCNRETKEQLLDWAGLSDDTLNDQTDAQEALLRNCIGPDLCISRLSSVWGQNAWFTAVNKRITAEYFHDVLAPLLQEHFSPNVDLKALWELVLTGPWPKLDRSAMEEDSSAVSRQSLSQDEDEETNSEALKPPATTLVLQQAASQPLSQISPTVLGETLSQPPLKRMRFGEPEQCQHVQGQHSLTSITQPTTIQPREDKAQSGRGLNMTNMQVASTYPIPAATLSPSRIFDRSNRNPVARNTATSTQSSSFSGANSQSPAVAAAQSAGADDSSGVGSASHTSSIGSNTTHTQTGNRASVLSIPDVKPSILLENMHARSQHKTIEEIQTFMTGKQPKMAHVWQQIIDRRIEEQEAALQDLADLEDM